MQTQKPSGTNRAKAILTAYRDACIRRDSLIRQIGRVQDDLTRATQVLSPVPGSGSREPDRMGTVVCRLVELRERLSAEAEKERKAADRALSLIAALQVPEHRALLTLRYVEGLSWARIAEEMHYSERWVKHIHGMALLEANLWLCGQETGGK